jgi:hypothetical protein
VRALDVLPFVVIGSVVVALTVLLLKREGKITLSWGAVLVAEAVILTIGLIASDIWAKIVASI